MTVPLNIDKSVTYKHYLYGEALGSKNNNDKQKNLCLPNKKELRIKMMCRDSETTNSLINQPSWSI